MAIKIYDFPVIVSVVPLSLIDAVHSSAPMFGDGPAISASIKSLNTVSNVEAMYEGTAPVRFKNLIHSPPGNLQIGGRNGARGGTAILVAGLHDFERDDVVHLKNFTSTSVIAAQGSTTSQADPTAIANMRAGVTAKSALDIAAIQSAFAIPPLPTMRVTSAAWSAPTPSKIVQDVPLVMPTFSANNDVLTAFLMQAARDAVRKWSKVHSIKVDEPVILSPFISNYSHYYEMNKVSVMGLSIEKRQVNLPLYVDDATGLISMAPLATTPEIDAKLEFEKALAQELDAAYRENRPAVLPPLPPLTNSPKDVQWNKGMQDILRNFNAARPELAQTAYDEAVAGGYVGTLAEWLASQTAKVPADKTALGENSTWWQSALDAISAGGSKVWDTVSDWGPTGLVTAYGGITAVNEAKKTEWLIPALVIGGAALLILK